MAITKVDWLADLQERIDQQKAHAPKVEYRTIDESIAWTQLREWVEDYRKKEQALLHDAIQHFMDSGNYAFDGLASAKARLDIINSRVLLLEDIHQKVLDYHKEE